MIVKACVNNDILTFSIDIKKSGNTCPYEVNFIYDSLAFEFYSIDSMYGNYNAANKKLSISALYHGMQFTIIYKLKVIDVTRLPKTLEVNIPQIEGCDTITQNNDKVWDIIKASYPDCPRNCEDMTSSVCGGSFEVDGCLNPPYDKIKLNDCFLCSNGFNSVYSSTSNTNVFDWYVLDGYLYVMPIDPSLQWSLYISVNCNLGSCEYGPFGPYQITGVDPSYNIIYLADGTDDQNKLTCEDFDNGKIYFFEDKITDLKTWGLAYLPAAVDYSTLCFNKNVCAFYGKKVSGSPGAQLFGIELWVPFVDTDNDCPDYCTGDAIDYSKISKIDLTPYGGGLTTVANDAAVIAAFDALDLTVLIYKCGVRIQNWDKNIDYADIEVVHNTSEQTVFIEDGDENDINYAQLYTVTFNRLYFDMTDYGGNAKEKFVNGTALKNRMNELTMPGWLWEESSGGNYARLRHPALSTAISAPDIVTQRIVRLIDTNEGIIGTGINNNTNGNLGAVINYDVITEVNLTLIGGTTKTVHTEIALLSELSDLSYNAEVYRADILLTNWVVTDACGDIEVSFKYECWSGETECENGTSNKITINSIDYNYPATSYASLPLMLSSIGIPGFIAAKWDSTLNTFKISLKQGYGGAAVHIEESCESTLTLTKISTSTTSCVTI